MENMQHINNVEKEIDYTFAKDYKEYLLNNPALRPENNILKTPSGNEKVIRYFYSMNPNDKTYIVKFQNFDSELKGKLVPFAELEFGDTLCFERETDKVGIYNHEADTFEIITGNWNNFIKNLRSDKSHGDRPVTTLFLLESLDGKISSGASDELDVDKDWRQLNGVKEGIYQYDDIQAATDLFSLNTGRVMAKIGVNKAKEYPQKIGCTFVIIDNKPHLDKNGIDYLCHWVDKLILVTTNRGHIAYSLQKKYDNLDILSYNTLDLARILHDIKDIYHAESITVQSGGSLNSLFLRENLIDYVNIVIAPILVGGKDTPTLIDGESIKSSKELSQLRPLILTECNQLKDSYVQLKYKVVR